jgi:hypothetical protein
VGDVPQLGALTDEEVSGIAFVRDYVEVHFDGPILRAFAPPTVTAAGVQSEFPAAGSRDALCQLIGEVVQDALDEDTQITLRFRDGSVLEIPKTSPGVGAEIAEFIPTRDGTPDIAGTEVWENLVPTRTDPS